MDARVAHVGQLLEKPYVTVPVLRVLLYIFRVCTRTDCMWLSDRRLDFRIHYTPLITTVCAHGQMAAAQCSRTMQLGRMFIVFYSNYISLLLFRANCITPPQNLTGGL